MRIALTPAERIIVDADRNIPKTTKSSTILNWGIRTLEDICFELRGTGVYIQVNTLLKLLGYSAIELIHSHGLRAVADLKISDTGDNFNDHGVALQHFKPDLATVMCTTGEKAIRNLKAQLPDTELLGIPVPSDFSRTDCRSIYQHQNTATVTHNLAQTGIYAGLDGLVCSVVQSRSLRAAFSNNVSINCLDISPDWSVEKGTTKNQHHIIRLADAVALGADRLIIGSPITKSKDPYTATMRTLDEVSSLFTR